MRNKILLYGKPKQTINLTGGQKYILKFAEYLEGGQMAEVVDLETGSGYRFFDSLMKLKINDGFDLVILPSTMLRECSILIVGSKFGKRMGVVPIVQEQDWRFGRFLFLKKVLLKFIIRSSSHVIVCSHKMQSEITNQLKLNPR